MDWREAITRRWQYKVAALFVAVLLWVTVSTDEQQEQAVPTRIEWELRDSSHVLVEAPGQVQTVFQAQMGDLLSFVGNNPVIRYSVDTVTSREMRISLATSMVQYGQVGSARPVAVRPSQVLLRFEPRVRRRVPVRPRVRAEAAEGFAVADSPRAEPDSVAISGAESEVERIDELTTEEVVLEELEDEVRRDVPVRLPDDAPNVSADPEIVLVTVDVDSVAERTLRVPVRIRGGDAGRVGVEPDSVTVRLRGPATPVAAVPADSVDAWVDLSDGLPEAGESAAFPVAVGLSGHPRVEATAEPAEAEVRRPGTP